MQMENRDGAETGSKQPLPVHNTSIDMPGIFCVLRGQNLVQFPMELGDFFPNMKKKSKSQDWDFHSVTTLTSYMVTIYYQLYLLLSI